MTRKDWLAVTALVVAVGTALGTTWARVEHWRQKYVAEASVPRLTEGYRVKVCRTTDEGAVCELGLTGYAHPALPPIF